MQIRSEHDPEIKMIWEQVNNVAQTDADAMEIFYEFSKVFGGKNCGHTKIRRKVGDRKSICEECGVICWFTAGTLLSRCKRFKAYLTAMLIREAGWLVSAFGLSRLTGVHYATAFNIQAKLNIAMANQMSEQAVETDGRPFAMIIARRSRETPARMHPIAEQDEIENVSRALEPESEFEVEDSVEIDLEVENGEVVRDADSKPLSDFESAIGKISQLLTKDGISAEKLAIQTSISIGLVYSALTMLEIDGKAKELPGGKFISLATRQQTAPLTAAQIALNEWLVVATNTIVQIIDEFFHRVSRKNIQLYFAAIWCALDRERWGESSVIQLCFNHPPVTYKKVARYVSPPLLKIMLPE